jgi:hypothetical protein
MAELGFYGRRARSTFLLKKKFHLCKRKINKKELPASGLHNLKKKKASGLHGGSRFLYADQVGAGCAPHTPTRGLASLGRLFLFLFYGFLFSVFLLIFTCFVIPKKLNF